MNKKDREALKTVLDELYRLTPKTSNQGFLPSGDVRDAIVYLLEKIDEKTR